jgi:hypothetical protein
MHEQEWNVNKLFLVFSVKIAWLELNNMNISKAFPWPL